MAKKKPPAPTVKPYPKELERKLRKAEVDELGPKLAGAHSSIGELEDQFKQVKADWGARIQAAEIERDRLASAIQTGVARESVMVFDEPDERRGDMITKRVDTGEEIGRRPFSAEERQQWLPGTETAKDDGPDDDEELN